MIKIWLSFMIILQWKFLTKVQMEWKTDERNYLKILKKIILEKNYCETSI